MRTALNIFITIIITYTVVQIGKLYSWYNRGKTKGYTWALNRHYVIAKRKDELTRYLFYIMVAIILLIINNN